MRPDKSKAIPHEWLVAGLCTAFFLQCLFSARQKSPTSDEPQHIMAGASYIATRKIVANPQHPPLLKELAGLSMALAGVHWRNTAGEPLESLPVGWEWSAGNKFLGNAGVVRTLFWARLPLLLLCPLLAFLVYWWGRELGGAGAGLGALFLLAADPTMVAHSYLVTTDSGLATFSLLFLLALYRHVRQPSTGRLIAAGAALGLVLAAKSSAVFLLPVTAVLLLAGWYWTPAAPDGTGRRGIASVLSDMAVLGVLAVVVIQLCYFSWRGPQLYLFGLGRVNADHNPDVMTYLGGQLQRRFVSYFAIAWLLKEPLATIALSLGGAFLAWRSKTIPRLAKLFLFLPPAVFFAAATVWADDIGVRYDIPAMVFGYIAGGIALAALMKGRMLGRIAAVGACAWVALAAAGIYPDHLSYFNEAACLPGNWSQIGLDGGTRCGPDWLADSNVDWGQSLPQLKEWLDRNAPGKTIRLEYFGTFPPTAYGIDFEKAGPYISQMPTRGTYVISSHSVAFGPVLSGVTWLREEPEAIVGHAYYIFEF